MDTRSRLAALEALTRLEPESEIANQISHGASSASWISGVNRAARMSHANLVHLGQHVLMCGRSGLAELIELVEVIDGCTGNSASGLI
jgi:hypothetical protein